MFNEQMISGMEWQSTASQQTTRGEYRVEVSWVLDRFRIKVFRRVQEPEKLRAVRHSWSVRNTVKTANRLIRQYNRQESF